jgi:protoporphyrinogen oxidase
LEVKPKTCIILGAGIAGLTLADRLSDDNWQVIILEKREFLGGLCRAVSIDSLKVDLGPHNLRARDPCILKYLYELLGTDLQTRNFRAKIVFLDRMFDYPMNPFQVMKNLPAKTIWFCCFDFVLERLKTVFHRTDHLHFESWAISAYGRSLYSVFFGPLTEKVWGVPGDSLDVNYALERLGRFYLRSLLGIKPRKNKRYSELGTVQHYYPRHGVYQIVSKIHERLLKKGVSILLNSEIREIFPEDDGITVKLKDRVVRGDFLASSIPINTFTQLCPNLDDIHFSVVKYRGLGFLYLSVPRPVTLPGSWLYFADPVVPFTRITDFSYCSEDLVTPQKNILCVEFGTKTKTQTEIEKHAEEVLSYLKKMDLVDLSVIYEKKLFIERVVYPVYQTDYSKDVEEFLNRMRNEKRMISFGRQGQYAFIDIDQVMLNAFETKTAIDEKFDKLLN